MCERNTDQLSLACPQLGAWPTIQACTLTGNRTGEHSVCRQVLNPLSHTSQDCISQSFSEQLGHSYIYIYIYMSI